MAGAKNFYEVLGVPEDASQDTIQGTYRKLAVKFHPDKNPGDKEAEERFKELGQAYAVLSDPGKRAQYDQQLRSGFPPEGFSEGGGGQWGSISVDEILRRYGDLFGVEFGGGGFGGGGFGGPGFGGAQGPFGQGPRMRRRGRDVEASITVPFREATLGDKVQVTLHGAEGMRQIEIRLPEGTVDGATLRLQGQGHPGAGGGPAGDLFLRLEVTPDVVYRRHGNDIEADLDVPAPVAVLGGRVSVRTIHGKEGTVSVPSGTSGGTLLRLRGQGVLGGDHLARVIVTVPKEPSEEETKLYEQLLALEAD